ncbi:MAG TPA: hypothetical protein VFH80_27190 [Solirubrobacteraceae bacterium]|nr:hypothetical protein [Solirubrobacteraceae bacterium]
MSITHCSRHTNIGGAGGNTLARRWCVASRRIRKTLAGIRDPRLRADIHRLVNAYSTGRVPEATPEAEATPAPAATPPHGERAQALATVCEALLRQFDDDQAGAAEIRLVVHKRDIEPVAGPRPDPESLADMEDEELFWELRRLLASSGGTIADVGHALERRGDDIDRKGRDLLEDEVSAIELDIAVLKVLLSDPVDWDTESKRLLAGEVPPFEDRIVDADADVDDEDE